MKKFVFIITLFLIGCDDNEYRYEYKALIIKDHSTVAIESNSRVFMSGDSLYIINNGGEFWHPSPKSDTSFKAVILKQYY